MNIILDPGHGGLDHNGEYTTAPNKQFYHEKQATWAFEGVINRVISDRIFKSLGAIDPTFSVHFTVHPGDPTDLSLKKRVQYANSFPRESAIFVSIHCNASPKHNARGFEVFTTRGVTKSDDLATKIINSCEGFLDAWGVGVRKDYSDSDPDKEAQFYVLKHTNCPAVLIECGFFDNWQDFKHLSNPVFQSYLSSYIASGIVKYAKDQ